MTLFSVTKPNINLTELCQMCGPKDAILLLQDAVYLCLRDDINWPVSDIYVLHSDIAVRQIDAPSQFTLINAQQWVELIVDSKVNLLWQS